MSPETSNDDEDLLAHGAEQSVQGLLLYQDLHREESLRQSRSSQFSSPEALRDIADGLLPGRGGQAAFSGPRLLSLELTQ